MTEISEQSGDLFALADTHLAHCISADNKLGLGIAAQFVKRYPDLRNQLDRLATPVNECAVVKRGEIFIYNLVTKEKFYKKPTLRTLEASLRSMLKHAKANSVLRIAMPRIGCGLDRLKWADVRALIETVFRGSGILITVCDGRIV